MMCDETTIENWSTWWNFQWSTELQSFHQDSSKGTWSHKKVAYICKTMPQISFPKVPLDSALWTLPVQLMGGKSLRLHRPADVREVVACPWMNMGGLLMTNLICFNDVRWNHNWELVHLVEFHFVSCSWSEQSWILAASHNDPGQKGSQELYQYKRWVVSLWDCIGLRMQPSSEDLALVCQYRALIACGPPHGLGDREVWLRASPFLNQQPSCPAFLSFGLAKGTTRFSIGSCSWCKHSLMQMCFSDMLGRERAFRLLVEFR